MPILQDMKRGSQIHKIFKVLQDANGGWVSCGYMRRDMFINEAPARISELKRLGYDIETSNEENKPGKSWDEYGYRYYRLKPKGVQTLTLEDGREIKNIVYK